MAAAYEIIASGHVPREILLLNSIKRFGSSAVMGRSYLGVSEIRRFQIIEGLYMAYQGREKWSNAVKWMGENPYWMKILMELDNKYKRGKEDG